MTHKPHARPPGGARRTARAHTCVAPKSLPHHSPPETRRKACRRFVLMLHPDLAATPTSGHHQYIQMPDNTHSFPCMLVAMPAARVMKKEVVGLRIAVALSEAADRLVFHITYRHIGFEGCQIDHDVLSSIEIEAGGTCGNLPWLWPQRQGIKYLWRLPVPRVAYGT